MIESTEKAVLVINMPENIEIRQVCGVRAILYDGISIAIASTNGVLKPLPEKKEIFDGKLPLDKMAEYIGYNACLDEITGEKE